MKSRGWCPTEGFISFFEEKEKPERILKKKVI